MPAPSAVLADKPRLVAALRAVQWIISEAARDLGVTRQGLKKAIRRHGIVLQQTPRDVMSRFLSEAGARGGRPRKTAA